MFKFYVSDSPLSRAESKGFFGGRPNSFPNFESVGGFGPMLEDGRENSE